MNTPIRRLSIAFLAMFVALLVNITYVQVFQKNSLDARPDNRRVLLDEQGRARGAIMLSDNTVLAMSTPVADEYKYQRQYPKGEVYAAATGFYSLVFGRSGIERKQNDVLSGTDDRLFVRRVVDLVTGKLPEGGSVKLTLNAAAQQAAYDGLKGKKGAVVALDPSTGAILAMATSPSYDPTPLASHSTKTQQDAWNSLIANPDKPADNRAIARTYPPGSVFKIVTTAAALESGKYTPGSVIPGQAVYLLPGTSTSLPNESKQSCGANDQTTLLHALEISCNTAYAQLGVALGADAMSEQAQKFGFDSAPMSDLNAATSAFPRDIDKAQTALSSIGQFDVRTTPLQVAMTSAAVANGGVLMKPYLVSEVLDPKLAPLQRAEPQKVSQAVSPATARQLTDMMVSVVQNGTGKNAQISGVPVAGKTGTAQSSPERPPYAWFTSFAPADDNPKVAVAVVIEDDPSSTRDEIAGGRLAAPIAKAVMQAVIGQ